MRIERNVLVPLADGVTLAADLYLPDGPGPFPALVTTYPYRKDDVIGSFSEHPRRVLVERGYAHLLVDCRGYGGSEGESVESMDPRPEGRDGAEVVEWAAAQSWCDGAVGMWGVSYGGLTALATAAERPPHLLAIVSVYGLWDVFRNALAPGGTPLMLGRYARECLMLAQELAPPSYQDPDGRWLAVWRQRLARLEGDGPHSLRWQQHPEDDAYWRERTIELERIELPTFLVGGWRDLFPEATVQAFERIPGARRLLIGPWLHVPPDLGPEPVDWLGAIGDFFDAHLRGRADSAGVELFVQRRGWRRASAWPVPAERREWVLGEGGLARDAPAAALDADPTVGVAAGLYDPLGTGSGFPGDQCADDLRSLTFTSEPLADGLEVTGSPEASLAVAVEAGGPVDLSVKLVDVGPCGDAALVTTGWARVAGDADSNAAVRLFATSWWLAPGHRLRLSVACADFPRLWPTPGEARLRVGGGRLALPVVTADFADEPPPAPPAVAERFPWSVEGDREWTTTRDDVAGTVSVTVGGGETLRVPSGARVRIAQRATATAGGGRAPSVAGEARVDLSLPDGSEVEVEAKGRFWRGRVLYDAEVRLDGVALLRRGWRSW